MKHSFKKLAISSFAAAGLMFAAGASAHDAWLAKIHGEYTAMYGHEPADTDAYAPERIVDAIALKNGSKIDVKVIPHENKYATFAVEKPAILGFAMDNGFWSKSKDNKWENKPKSETANPSNIETSIRSIKYIVSYLNNRESVKPLGYALEIIPASNPAKLKKGDKLTVQVLYKGKPVANADVTSDLFTKSEKLKTDSKGNVTFVIPNSGLNIFATSHKAEFEDKSKANEYSLSSSLAFETNDEHHHE